MGKREFQARWIKSCPWVKPSKKSENHACCSMCASEINVSAGVTASVERKSKKT